MSIFPALLARELRRALRHGGDSLATRHPGDDRRDPLDLGDGRERQKELAALEAAGLSRYALVLIPLVAFCGIAATAAKKLYDQDFHGKNIAEIPSALIGTKAPSLNLPPLEGSTLPALTSEAVKAKLTLVSVLLPGASPAAKSIRY